MRQALIGKSGRSSARSNASEALKKMLANFRAIILELARAIGSPRRHGSDYPATRW
jgi:hypothetical protein